MTLPNIWPVSPVQLNLEGAGIDGISPIPIIWVIGGPATGKTTFVATVDPVRPGDATRTVLAAPLDETQKAQAYTRAGNPGICGLFGAYNWRYGEVACRIDRMKKSEAFIAFLERLTLTDYPRNLTWSVVQLQ